MMLRYFRIAAAAAGAAIVLTACGSNDSSTPSADAGSSSSSASSAAPTTSDTGSGASSAPGGTSSAPAGGSAPATATITIKDFKFGAPLTVAPGAKITITNQDTSPHNAVSDGDNGAAFKTELLQKGESAEITAPSKPGTYKYSCTVHANMTGIGTLIVKG